MRAHRHITGVLLGVVVALVAGADARAGLYRCERPDGRTTYTDNPAACPSAKRHEPSGAVQNVLTGAPPSAPRPSSRAGSLEAEVEATAEANWRQRKQSKQAELEQLESKHEKLRKMVVWCNRGGEVLVKDEIGLKRTVPCSKIDSDFTSVESRIAAVKHYLDEGLEDECRRSGCLPGWIR